MGDHLTAFLRRHVDSGLIPGAVAVLGSADAEAVSVGALSADGPPMPTDAIMRIQSMTKVVTAVAALRLVEAGSIALDDSVEVLLPELVGRRVLTAPDADLADTVAAERPITLRHLLTNTAGYGTILTPSPLHQAMADNKTESGPDPVSLGADEWLARLSELPLAFQPGEGWRYHHSFAILGILLSRLVGRPLGEHLADDLFDPLAMSDTGFWVPSDQLHRLPAGYRHDADGLTLTEPAGGGFYAGPPTFDVSHAELVSTAADFHRFLRALIDGSLVNADHLALLTTDQVPSSAKAADSFFPGFWDSMGWGFGVGVVVAEQHRGRYGWSGGQGTDFFVDPDGTVGILLTQVELSEATFAMVEEFQALHASV